MKSLTGFTLLVLLCSSCHDQNSEGKNNVASPSMRFYYRVQGCNNGYCTYNDFVALENYENNRHSIGELASMAYQYLDTAKADMPISHVTFVGEKKGTRLPPGMTKLYYQHADKQVVSFSFNNSVDSLVGKLNINAIAIWKNGEAVSYEYYSVDSLLNSNTLLDNED